MMLYSYDRWLRIFYMHYHIDMIIHGTALLNQRAALVGQVNSVLVEFHLAETNGSYWARTWTVDLTHRNVIVLRL